LSAERSDDAGACAKCGADELTDGHLFWNAPIRFKAEGASQFRRGAPVRALACSACGHIELSLEK
jgi:hypothetical protein